MVERELLNFPFQFKTFFSRRFNNDDRVDWTNPMKTNDMFAVIPLKRWVLIYPRRNQRETRDFLKMLFEVANGMHYEMAAPKELEIGDDRIQSYTKAVEEVAVKDPKMIMVVVPNNTCDRYAAIKKLTCINRAIPTQVIVAKTMLPKKGNIAGLRSIATKVMIQLNCKLGGAPWMINFPLKGVMTIGFDVTHDTSDRSKSYGAFVATMDLQKNVNFYSAVSPHIDGAELSTNLANHLNQALREFRIQHGSLPERIFLYRDGVGDGQIEYVHKQEINSLTKKLDMLYERFGEGKSPKLTFIIINKRLNTRIFLNTNGHVVNPVSGTVVDTVITLPER